jgi:hypothetical protein
VNCRFHDASRHNECLIGTTEWVGDREGANFCDEFEFRDTDAAARGSSEAGKAKDALDSLFGGGEDESGPDLDDFRELFSE